ncbi:MAG TPA: serine hydrolase domain-containing protein [Burkholderiales bacterium]|jgi:CubicO group peptidase (beta-lactamase class C family)|nr:serine hydrolase domain-containing protein [Burkholderiales bacterium]
MAIYRREFLKAGAALVAAAAAQQSRVALAGPDLKQSADEVLEGGVDAGDVPGVIAMATTPGGTIYEGAFGKRALDQDTAMSLDTVVWIASMTKALTGAAAMQQVEQGKLSLDTPAAKIYPPLDEIRVLTGWDSNGKPITRKPKRPITLRHLLTHTAGFAYELWNTDIQQYQKVMDLPGIGACKNDSLKMPLMFDPGDRWEYGINIDFAGKMVETVSGQRLGEYFQENLFGPLGMDSTGFKITPDMRARLAKVHQRSPEGVLAPIEFEMTQEPEFEMGGGGIYSTAGDYLEFVRMMLNRGKGNGNQILNPETVALMSRNAMGNNRVTMLKTAIPPLTNDAEFFPGMVKSWGLSFMINDHEAPTGRSRGSLAWAGLANTYYWIDQRQGVAGVYMTQVLPFADAKALPLFYAFEKSVYQSMG